MSDSRFCHNMGYNNHLIDTFLKIFAKAIIIKNNEPLNNEKAKRMNRFLAKKEGITFTLFNRVQRKLSSRFGDLAKNKDLPVNAYLCHCCQ